MVNKYSEFLLEKKRYTVKLLLEAYLQATSDFMNKLKTMTKEKGVVGEISTAIHDFIDKQDSYIRDSKIKQNYFNTTDKEDMVSFLMNNKVPKDWNDEVDPSLPYNTRGRGEIKISKAIKYILQLMEENGDLSIDTPKDKDIEAFVNLYKSTSTSSNFKFKFLKGDDIAKYYNNKKYFSQSGSLGGSCMADESKGTFKIYSQNESKVRLLVFIDEEADKISGRALVWKLKNSPCEAKYFMDRVYTNRDSDFFRFRQYAEENEFLYKQFMNSQVETNVSFKYKGSDVFGEITVKLDGKAKNYPFVDTLCFMDKNETYLSNLSFENAYFLHDVYGKREICDDCDGRCILCDDCRYEDEDKRICDYCSDGDTDSGKCVTCKGTGMVKCEHENSPEFCSSCSDGHDFLNKKGIETELNKILNK